MTPEKRYRPDEPRPLRETPLASFVFVGLPPAVRRLEAHQIADFVSGPESIPEYYFPQTIKNLTKSSPAIPPNIELGRE